MNLKDPETEFPLAQLGLTIRRANEPLVRVIQELNNLLRAGVSGVSVSRDPVRVYDMESAIKEAKKWECGDLHCRECTIDQNVYCIQRYGVLPKALADTQAGLHQIKPRAIMPVVQPSKIEQQSE